MPIQAADAHRIFNGHTILCKLQGTSTVVAGSNLNLDIFPPYNMGIGKVMVTGIIVENIVYVAGSLGPSTVAFGSNSPNFNDFFAAALLTPASGSNCMCIFPPSTLVSYAPGAAFVMRVTSPSSGTCDITMYGLSI